MALGDGDRPDEKMQEPRWKRAVEMGWSGVVDGAAGVLLWISDPLTKSPLFFSFSVLAAL